MSLSRRTPSKPPGLSGFVVSKNCLSLDYCITECINSLLPICQEVVVGEMGSDDGTREFLDKWAAVEPRLHVVSIRDWTKERCSMTWYTSALNETREYLQYASAVNLDADEVLGDDFTTHEIVLKAAREMRAIALDRLNFARDAKSLIPEHHCLGKYVVRVGPSNLWWPSDEPHQRGEVPLLDAATITPDAKIFHLGFLRKPEAFFKKARVVLGAFFDNYDSRLAEAEEKGLSPLAKFPWFDRLEPYNGRYPDSVRKWLTERGFLP